MALTNTHLSEVAAKKAAPSGQQTDGLLGLVYRINELKYRVEQATETLRTQASHIDGVGETTSDATTGGNASNLTSAIGTLEFSVCDLEAVISRIREPK